MIKTNPLLLDVAQHLDSPDTLSAGKLCLEFANTSNWHASPTPEESLFSYDDLLNWAVGVGIRSQESAETLRVFAASHPALSEQIYTWAIDLREAIYRTFAAISRHEPPSSSDLALLNEALPHAYTLPEIVENGGIFLVRYRGDGNGLDSILWPIIRSATRLLTDGEYSRIGQCEDDRGCGYLFYDTSRNRSRRWCAMGSCGNRAKSQRHYARQRRSTKQ